MVGAVRTIISGKLRQGPGQLLRCAGLFRGKTGDQVGNPVPHHGLKRFHRKFRPAVGTADVISRSCQIVNGIQKRSIQIKNYGMIHECVLSFIYGIEVPPNCGHLQW